MTPTPPPAATPVIATITGDALLERLEKLATTMQELVTKLDPIPRTVADHESRLRALERKVWTAAGASSLLSGGLVAAVLEAVRR